VIEVHLTSYVPKPLKDSWAGDVGGDDDSGTDEQGSTFTMNCIFCTPVERVAPNQ